MAALVAAGDARAQCGGRRSECSACHDGGRAPAAATGAWHEDHVFADLCPVCHEGDGDAREASGAHVGLATALTDMRDACASCHDAAAPGLAERYQAAAGKPRVAGAPASLPGPGGPDASSGTPAARVHGARGPNLALGGAALALGLLGALGVMRRERRLARSARGTTPDDDPSRHLPVGAPGSPIAAGIGLGLVVTASMAVFGHRLSGAGAYQHLSGLVGRSLAPGSAYWRYVVPTGVTWDVLVLIGGLLGAFTAAKLSGQFSVRTMPDRQWTGVFGPSVALRWGLAFVGSLLTELAGGIAGGCTASLAVSGGAVLAPGAFAFMAGMFAGGVPVALLLYRKRAG